MGLSVFTSSPHEDQEQKTVGKKVSRIETGSILVLDDDFDINNIIKLVLQNHGYNVFGFTPPLGSIMIITDEHIQLDHLGLWYMSG
jgi:hypothetical protein